MKYFRQNIKWDLVKNSVFVDSEMTETCFKLSNSVMFWNSLNVDPKINTVMTASFDSENVSKTTNV